MINARMETEDRDLAWVFLDLENASPDAAEITIQLEGIDLLKMGDEPAQESPDQPLWLMGDSPVGVPCPFRVVKRGTFDFTAPQDWDSWFPIPTPVILADEAEMQRHLES